MVYSTYNMVNNKNPFEQKATCEASKKEILRDKRMFIYVVIFGLLCILATILLG